MALHSSPATRVPNAEFAMNFWHRRKSQWFFDFLAVNLGVEKSVWSLLSEPSPVLP
jgi:hypothetical protein